MNYNVGVVGCGFVGSAVAAGFSLHVDSVKMYDRYKDDKDYHTLDETVNESDIIFVCVPTPNLKDGKQDLSFLQDCLSAINRVSTDPKTIIIKSTVLPGTCRTYARAFNWHSIVYNPEFLSARTARLDFINPARIILGGEIGATQRVAELYKHRFGNVVPICKVEWETAEMVKYTANCFFAMKIAFCNEVYNITQALNIDYNEVKELWLMDGKITHSHCDVPGHDGRRGYGGSCFPKDVKAFITWAEDNSIDIDILNAVHKSNLKNRKELLDEEEI